MLNHYTHRIETRADVDRLFQNLYSDVARAHSRADLAELYSRAQYWALLAESPAWRSKFAIGDQSLSLGGTSQFRRVARRINIRAKQIGLDAHFAESWREK